MLSRWVRETVDIPMRNEAAVVDVAPATDGLLAATLNDGSILHAAFVGDRPGWCRMWWMPEFVAALPVRFRAHTADPIDFQALRGRRVAVLGAGASAFDNAAMALEAGAAEVTLFCRRRAAGRAAVSLADLRRISAPFFPTSTICGAGDS